jgi:hypothetical protein
MPETEEEIEQRRVGPSDGRVERKNVSRPPEPLRIPLKSGGVFEARVTARVSADEFAKLKRMLADAGDAWIEPA